MKITRYGITLERLLPEHSEMVRKWRNDQKISQFMFYKGEITAAMQQEWFDSIDNDQNFFFIINYKSVPVGLINISSIDWENKTAYSGLFIYEEKFWGSDVPVMASLAMLDVFFLLFNVQSVYAKVKGNNKVAHNYNSALGFSRTKKIERGLGYEYMLQKEIYLLETKSLRNAAIHLKGNETRIELLSDNPIDKWIGERLGKVKKEIIRNLDVRITNKKYTCPCCGYKTLEQQPPGTYDICPICFWEDDDIQFADPDYEGGANKVSLKKGQKNFLKFGACEVEAIKKVRKPYEYEERDNLWRQLD